MLNIYFRKHGNRFAFSIITLASVVTNSINIGSGNGLVPSGNKPCLSQCWPRSMPPCGVTRPQWVKFLSCGRQVPKYMYIYIYYCGCWWPGITRSQGINSQCIDLVCQEYFGFSTTRVRVDTYIYIISYDNHCGLEIPYGNIDQGQHWFR